MTTMSCYNIITSAEYESIINYDDTRLLAVNRSHLTFQLPKVNMNWTLLCPTFNEYVIHSSNCGKCPQTVDINDTIALCDISDSVRYTDDDDEFRDTICTFEAVAQVQCESTDQSVNTSAETIIINLKGNLEY